MDIYPPTPVPKWLVVTTGALNPRHCGHPPRTSPAQSHWPRDAGGRELVCMYPNSPLKLQVTSVRRQREVNWALISTSPFSIWVKISPAQSHHQNTWDSKHFYHYFKAPYTSLVLKIV